MDYAMTFVLMMVSLAVGIVIGAYGSAIGFYSQIEDGILIMAEDEDDDCK